MCRTAGQPCGGGLFGIEKGVATGVDRRIGKFEEANGGTLFLDEIGDLSLPAQAKILRVLQERSVDRVGGKGSVPIDVRIIAATNQTLAPPSKNGRFEDLYYRLKVIHIQTPLLRDVSEDIPVLANHFLSKYCKMMNTELEAIYHRSAGGTVQLPVARQRPAAGKRNQTAGRLGSRGNR